MPLIMIELNAALASREEQNYTLALTASKEAVSSWCSRLSWF